MPLPLDWITTRAAAAAIELAQNAMAPQLPKVLIEIVANYAYSSALGLEVIAQLARYGERDITFYIDEPPRSPCYYYQMPFGDSNTQLVFLFTGGCRCAHTCEMSDAVLWDFACGEPLPQELIDDMHSRHAFELMKERIDWTRGLLRDTIEAVARKLNGRDWI